MKRILLAILIILFVNMPTYAMTSPPQTSIKSSSGVNRAKVKLKTGPDGLTVEQRNVKQRINEDNVPGSIKHFYVISPYSGQVIIYSTVRAKVTSSGKRLAPYEVETISKGGGYGTVCVGFDIYISGKAHITNEVLQDDGTYGHSVPYIFWWDSRSIYHQHFFTGGQIIHLSDQPLPIKNIIINMELSNTPQADDTINLSK